MLAVLELLFIHLFALFCKNTNAVKTALNSGSLYRLKYNKANGAVEVQSGIQDNKKICRTICIIFILR